MSLRIVTPEGELDPLDVKIKEAIELLRVSRSTIFRLIKAGELETVGSGSLTRVDMASIRAYRERHRNRRGAA